MRWQEGVFGPLMERTLENAQVRHLATYYDLSRDSNLARAIVREVNRLLDAEERRRQVQRVQSGEFVLKTSRGPLVLPLRTDEDLQRVISGERWPEVRRDILKRCEARYRQLFPEACYGEVKGFLRILWNQPIRSPRGHPSPFWASRRKRPWGPFAPQGDPLKELDLARSRKPRRESISHPRHRPETLLRLCHYLGSEAGIPPAIQEPMLLELMTIRARFHPRLNTLRSGQMALAAMHVEAGRSLWKPTRYQPLSPVVVTPLHREELNTLRHHPPKHYEDCMAFYGQRMARVLNEAYLQDGLLSFAELQWIFLTSTMTVSRAIDHYQRCYHVILPCPGTVLDMGNMLTHKNLIVRLYLQGMTVLEISKQTYHNPRSIDAYLKCFDAVLILHLYGLPLPLMARILGRGESLIHEYLELIGQYLKEPESMRNYLKKRGVKFSANLSSIA